MEKPSMAKAAQEDDGWPELEQLLAAMGDRIKKLRDQRGMTQKDLAAACDLKPPYVFEIERGYANITMRTALRLANALSVSPRDLLTTASSEEADKRLLQDKVTRIIVALTKIVEDETQAVSEVVDSVQALEKTLPRVRRRT
jgi:putative transcriptional regulator